MQMFAVKTSIAHEKGVADMIYSKLQQRNPRPDVKSILVIDQLRGYVFIEANHQRDVMLSISEIRHIKGKVGQIKLEELDHFLKPEPITESLEIGDKLEIIAGLFSGEKAFVSRIDESKDEVTLSLAGSDNPIPIKVHADYLKVIEKGVGPVLPAAAGEPTVVGRGIKEYTFGQTAAQKPKETETFADDFEKEGEEKKGKAPEVMVVSGHKQKVVGELIDLNVDEDEDEDLDDIKDEDLLGIIDDSGKQPSQGEPASKPEKKEKGSEAADEEEDNW